ncbi:MAG: PD-(D/E)XK nuclease family protein [Candidatus Subteraquimicrobiales bacterium]|nr:PD-(D/E)XK nuclease family protein [Candidatus Subteraquimicrobiales bacterium]
MNEQVLSPSAMMMFSSCEYAFKLKYIDKLKPVIEDDSALRLGKSVHAVLEHYYKNVNLNTQNPDVDLVEALKKTAQEKWDRTCDAKKRDEMNNSIFLWLQFEIQRFKKYKELNILDRFVPVVVEEDVTDWQKKLRAIIDKRCIGQNGNMYALDYKTDKNLPVLRNFIGDLKLIDDKYKIQSALIAMVLQSQGIKLDNFYFQFIRFPDKLLSVPLVPELFIEVERLIVKIRETTENEKNKKSCFYWNMKMVCKTENTCPQCITSIEAL